MNNSLYRRERGNTPLYDRIVMALTILIMRKNTGMRGAQNNMDKIDCIALI
jgi:hypothetical protein